MLESEVGAGGARGSHGCGLRTPLHRFRILRLPKSICVGGLYLWVFTVLEMKTENY